jgi:tRNA(Ile)-lysidine synthase TilS/MesJ
MKKISSSKGCSFIDITIPKEVNERLVKELKNPKKNKPWEEWEVNLLKEYRSSLTHQQLANILSRSRASIKSKLDYLYT